MKLEKAKIKTSRDPMVKLLSEWDLQTAKRGGVLAQQAAVKKEVADYIATLEPDDEEGLQLVSAKRTQLDIFPHSIKRLDAKIESLREPLISVATEFENGLKTELRALAERRRQVIAAELEPLFPWVNVSGGMHSRVVDDIAAKAKPVVDLLDLVERVDGSRHEQAAGAPDWSAQLPKAVRELLAMADEAAKL